MQSFDSVLYDALRESLTNAFFTPVTRYENGHTTSYGGQASDVVKKVLESPQFKALEDSIVGDIAKRKEEFRSIIETEWRKKIAESFAKEVGAYYSGYQYMIKQHLQNIAEPIIQEELKNNLALHEKIRQQINFENYKLRINVNVTVEPATETA